SSRIRADRLPGPRRLRPNGHRRALVPAARAARRVRSPRTTDKGGQMEFWDRLDAVAERFDVLRHPFYVRWSEGTLRRDELALYAGQYAHAVSALAAAARSVAERAPSATATEHAAEEEAHVGLWDEFARTAGANPARPLPETCDCAEAWADPGRALLPTLVALYAIESAQPAISKTKR